MPRVWINLQFQIASSHYLLVTDHNITSVYISRFAEYIIQLELITTAGSIIFFSVTAKLDTDKAAALSQDGSYYCNFDEDWAM